MTEENTSQPDICLIDADSLIYSISFVERSPNLAEKKLERMIGEIVEATEVDEAMVFIKGSNNFRYAVDINYKAHRKSTTPEEVQKVIDHLYDFAKDIYICSDNGEADDYCGIYFYKLVDEGRIPIVAHIDKDLNMIPGMHYNFKKQEFYFLSVEEAYIFLMRQLLTGDATDNIKGLPKVGPVKANKILTGESAKSMLDTVINKYKYYFKDSWEEQFIKVGNCILIRSQEEDLRPLSLEELIGRCTWESEDTDIYLPDPIHDVLYLQQLASDTIIINSENAMDDQTEEMKIRAYENKKKAMRKNN
jgi:5'-3' exonuclease